MFLKGIPFGLEIKVYNFSFLFLFTCSFDHEIQPRIGFYTKFASFHTLTVYVHRHGFLIGLTIRKIPFFLCRILWVPLKTCILSENCSVSILLLAFWFWNKKDLVKYIIKFLLSMTKQKSTNIHFEHVFVNKRFA